MPWKETCAMDERQAFIDSWLTKRFNFSDLCRRFGVSRKTGYKWLHRFVEGGRAALGDRSRAPYSHPNATSEEVNRRLLRIKHRFPQWGPVTVVSYLRREEPQVHWPAPSTVGELFKRHGLVEPRKVRRRTPPHSEPLRHVQATHDVWSADFKGDFALGNGQRCYPFTLSDNHSRFLIDCKGLHSIALEPVRARFALAFRQWGLPRAVRTDNGYPFASTGLGGLTPLSVWLLRLGVLPERIAPGQPQHNPRHERMHRTLGQASASPAKANFSAQQRAFNRFRQQYNEKRPHQGLADGQRPADLFQRSAIEMPSVLPEPHYPGEYETRRVRHKGEIKWGGQLTYVSQTLRHQTIGLEALGEGLYQLHFAALALGVLDARTGRIIRPDKLTRART